MGTTADSSAEIRAVQYNTARKIFIRLRRRRNSRRLTNELHSETEIDERHFVRWSTQRQKGARSRWESGRDWGEVGSNYRVFTVGTTGTQEADSAA